MNPPATKVCLVDDEPRGRQLLRDLLAHDGYTLIEAVDGADALATVLLELPDVVLLDVMMPKLDGFEVCRRLRAHEATRHVTIIMLTALDDRRSRLRGLEAGADDFISKPIDAVELRTRLRTVAQLNRFRTLSEERERFVTALTHSPDAIVIASPEGEIHFANQAFAQLLDLAHWAEAKSHQFCDLFPREQADGLRDFIARTGGNPARKSAFESALIHPSAPDTIVEITAGPLPWDGRPAMQFNLRNITEKKRLESQLMRSQRLELLGQLSSGIVHDVNNIFAAILGSAQLIEMAPADRAPTLLANIQTSAPAAPPCCVSS